LLIEKALLRDPSMRPARKRLEEARVHRRAARDGGHPSPPAFFFYRSTTTSSADAEDTVVLSSVVNRTGDTYVRRYAW
jgi:hypothetical protein